MGRPPDHFNPFRIKPRPAKGCAYASTRSSFIDPETGKRTTRRIRWGGPEDGERFIPDERLATPEELSQLIFPDGRDVREAVGFSGCGLGKAGLRLPMR